jgi:S-ribosylhomocysteine lyase
VIFEGDHDSREVLPVIREMLDWIQAFEGPIPGAAAAECGNWREQNLDMAKWEARRYAGVLKNPGRENLNYPE